MAAQRKEYPKTVRCKREYLHCAEVWEEDLTNEEIRKTIFHIPIGICPNPACQLPT